VAGDAPAVLALNKVDLRDRWALERGDEEALEKEWDIVRTSAKTGDGVEEAFRRIARGTLAVREARP
jgi:hypothetical protein